MAQILDGKTQSATIRAKIKERVTSLTTPPGLAVILVGNDPASHTYVSIKQVACEEVGIHFEKFLYPENESEEVIISKIHELNMRDDIHGILVQLPLPSQSADKMILEIDPKKDVDGFHPVNLQNLKKGENAIVSAVALGVMRLIRSATTKLDGLEATIVASPLFSEPLILLLQESGVHVTVVNSLDPSLTQKTKSDILIVAVGEPNLITKEMIKPGAVVIDVGTTRLQGVLYGDVDFEHVREAAGFLTPVPGGVGPMTVAMLLVNVLKAYSFQK